MSFSFITIEHLHIHADGEETARLLAELLERSMTMPTKQEVKDAVQAAVGEEAAQVATRLKALEDKIAELEVNGSFTEDDKAELVAMVQGIFTPA